MASEKIFSPVRVTAASEEAALQQALAMTGAAREDIEWEVLARNEKGVTVRVRPRRDAEAPAPELAAAPPMEAAPASAAPDEAVPDLDLNSATQDTSAEAATAAPEAVLDEEVEPEPESDLPATAPLERAAAPERAAPERTAAPVDPAVQERARSVAQEFLERMGLAAEAQIAPPFSGLDSSERVVPRVYLQIEGDDVGVLIGKHGQTLQSFQYLLNLTLNNNVPEAAENAGEAGADVGMHVMVDAGGYRVRRAAALEQMARDGAARAKRERRAVRLGPMPAHERRLVHIALREDSDITSGSEGQEPMRRVIITPAGVRAGGNEERGRFGQERSGGYGGGRNSGGYGGSGRGGSRGGRGGRGDGR